jgi:hypothetical protein
MAPKRVIRKSHQPQEPGYPSLRSHLTTRRRFLELTGATVAAGGLATACGRAMGVEGEPDASTPDAPGGDPGPEFYTVRIPITDELSAYLLDNGYAQFHVEAVTYVADTQNALLEHMSSAEDTCRQCVSEYTFDSLDTAAGVAACEDDLLTALDELVMDLEGHSNVTVEYVTLSISYLEPYAEMGGISGEPSYP